MDATAAGGFLRFVVDLPDPRGGCDAIHKLHVRVVIAVRAVIRGADGWVQVELFGTSQRKWLATSLELPGGVPGGPTPGGSPASSAATGPWRTTRTGSRT